MHQQEFSNNTVHTISTLGSTNIKFKVLSTPSNMYHLYRLLIILHELRLTPVLIFSIILKVKFIERKSLTLVQSPVALSYTSNHVNLHSSSQILHTISTFHSTNITLLESLTYIKSPVASASNKNNVNPKGVLK